MGTFSLRSNSSGCRNLVGVRWLDLGQLGPLLSNTVTCLCKINLEWYGNVFNCEGSCVGFTTCSVVQMLDMKGNNALCS